MNFRKLVLLIPVIAFTACCVSGCADKEPEVIEASDASAQPENYEEMSMGDANNQ